MKSGIVCALVLVLSAATSCGQQSSAVHAGPFHWNPDDSQELGGEDRISQMKSLNSMERERILDAIIQELKLNMREVATHTEQKWSAIAADTRIKLVDLNADGIPEVIAQNYAARQAIARFGCSCGQDRDISSSWMLTHARHSQFRNRERMAFSILYLACTAPRRNKDCSSIASPMAGIEEVPVTTPTGSAWWGMNGRI
jgi:hypothetical protein